MAVVMTAKACANSSRCPFEIVEMDFIARSDRLKGGGWVDRILEIMRMQSPGRLHGIAVTPTGTLWAVGTSGVFARPERTFILRKTP